MAYCPKCGVEVERDNHPCPLCKFPIPKVHDSDTLFKNRFPSAVNPYPMRLRQHILRFFSIFTIIVFFSTILLLYIDNITADRFSWSRYTTIIIASAWGILYFCLGFVPSFFKSMFGISTIALGLLLGIDYFHNGIVWFFPLALPIALGIILITTLFYLLVKPQFSRWFNTLGLLFTAITFICLWTDLMIGNYIERDQLFSWSIATAILLIPLAAGMFYITYGLSNQVKQKLIRKFHL